MALNSSRRIEARTHDLTIRELDKALWKYSKQHQE
jgi:hypothetical protein